MPGSVRIYIGLGANVGNARATLTEAVAALAKLSRATLRGVSRLYRTAPVGVTDQADFLNAVVGLDVPQPAEGNAAAGATVLLVQLKAIERAFGRRRGRRWGPRELDLDLLLYGDARLAIERPPAGVPLSARTDPAAATRLLEVPHPSMGDRLFVVAPLGDLDPDLVPPGWTESVGERRDALAAAEPEAVTPIAAWDPAHADWR